MTGVLTSILAFVVAIAVLVAVHEYGHFIVARRLGVKVIRYSIGFGRVLWSRRGRMDDTEYCISAIPLGGYVKLLDERDCAVSWSERERAFNRQSVPKRIAILAAGPGFNLLFAVAAYWIMFMTGIPGLKPVVGAVEPGSLAATAGLRGGELITAVGDRDVSTWERATLAMLDEMLRHGEIGLRVAEGEGMASRSVVLPVDGRESELTEPGQLFEGLGFAPWAPRLLPVIGEVTPGSPAERAGLRAGDRVTSVAGEAVDTWEQWVGVIRENPGEPLDVTVERGATQVDLVVEPERVASDGLSFGRIGAAARIPEAEIEAMRAEERYGVLPALARGAERTLDMTVLTVRMLWRMVTGDVSVRNISGPINIAQYAGYSATIGATAFLSFLAIVSISLGILNLLPVPMLDGGQIVYTLAEGFKGSPLSERAQLIGQQIGLGFLILLMSFAFYNDISRLLG